MQPSIKPPGDKTTSLSKFLTAAVLFLSLTSYCATVTAAPLCSQIFSASKASSQVGAMFLHERDPKLHTTIQVEKATSKYKRITGNSLTKPTDKINNWLNHLEALSNKATMSPRSESGLKRALYKQYVMKSKDVPDSYYAQQVRIARERGHGDIVFTQLQKDQMAETVISDLQKSLDSWTEFLISKDTQIYPMWLKYWMFTGMTKISKYDPQTGVFGNRSKETVAPFPELNSEALAYVADTVLMKLNKKSLNDINDPEYVNLLAGMNFGKLYGRTLFNLGIGKEGRFKTNEGQWKVYPQGSDHLRLVKSLEGQNTGWCTAVEGTAKSQLEKGDFHVYYSLDQNGNATVPRVAIRMEGNNIGEVRGVAADQNLDSQISQSPVVSVKMKEFGHEGENYRKKDSDMRMLTLIEAKSKLGRSLSKEELKFLYEIESNIQSFGRQKDPRIAEIKSQRDIKDDYVVILDQKYTRDEISFTREDFSKGKSKIHFGYLDLSDVSSAVGLNLPFIVNGGINLSGLTSTVGLKLPKIVEGPLVLTGLSSAKGLELPKEVKGHINLAGLTTAVGLELPNVIHDGVTLSSLNSVTGLKIPETFSGNLSFRNLTSADGLKLPDTFNGSIYILKGLTSAAGLKLPKIMNGDLVLDALTATEGLILPEILNGNLYLNGLTSASSLKIPKGTKDYYGPEDIQE